MALVLLPSRPAPGSVFLGGSSVKHTYIHMAPTVSMTTSAADMLTQLSKDTRHTAHMHMQIHTCSAEIGES